MCVQYFHPCTQSPRLLLGAGPSNTRASHKYQNSCLPEGKQVSYPKWAKQSYHCREHSKSQVHRHQPMANPENRLLWRLQPQPCSLNSFLHCIFSFSFSSKCFPISLLISTLVHGLSRSMVFSFQMFGDFTDTFLLLVFNLTLCGQRIYFLWFESI